jgi:hypothetical protein
MVSTTPNKNLSLFIDKQFPEYFREEAPMLVQFVKYYYEWMEQTGGTIDMLRTIQNYRDTDLTPDKFFDFLRYEFMQNIPQNLLVDKRLAIKHIIEFFRAKGSERAYRMLFRMLYNEEIDFYYPGKDMLRVSDGRWVIDKTMKVQLIVPITDLTAFDQFTGAGSGATASFQKIYEYYAGGVLVQEMSLTNIRGEFKVLEPLNRVDNGVTFGFVSSEGMVTHPGRYATTDGFISWDKFIQDSFFYQEFSYVIKSGQSLANFGAIAKKLVHPAGTRLFSIVAKEIDLPVNFDNNAFTVHSGPYNLESQQYIITLAVLGADISSDLDINSVGFSGKIILEILIPRELGSMVSSIASGDLNLVGDGTVTRSSNTSIAYYGPFTIGEMGAIPLNMFGNTQLIQGTGTHFKTQLDGYQILDIKDADNSANTIYLISELYSNTFLRIAEPYQFATLTDQPYVGIKVY